MKHVNIWAFGTALFGLILNTALSRQGYSFVPVSYTGFIVGFFILCALYVFFSVKYRNKAEKLSRVAALLMPVIMTLFVISLFELLETDGIHGRDGSMCVFWLAPVGLIASLIVFFAYAKREWVKITIAVISGFIAGIYLLFCSFSLFSAWFVAVEVTREIASPDKNYTVFIIEYDEGALGGSTKVCLRKVSDDVFVGMGTFVTKSHALKHGRWAQEYEICWKDNETLIIDGEEYCVDDY